MSAAAAATRLRVLKDTLRRTSAQLYLTTKKLFGGGGDWEKFWETNTIFAAAACLNQDHEVLEVCCKGLDVGMYKGALHTRTMELIVRE